VLVQLVQLGVFFCVRSPAGLYGWIEKMERE